MGLGTVFHVPDAEPFIQFNGPAGESPFNTGDGEATDTEWKYLALNPADGEMWGLRRDGTLEHAAIPAKPPAFAVPGTTEAQLPYDDTDHLVDIDELYNGFAFNEDGSWYVLRADSKVYSPAQSIHARRLRRRADRERHHTYRAILPRGQRRAARRRRLFRDFLPNRSST